MKCVSPFLVTKTVTWVPCGKCNFCLKKRRAEWSFRLFQELKSVPTAAFLTLTYSDDNLVYDVATRESTLEKSHFQKFMKMFRYYDSKTVNGRKRRTAIRYYAVGEYGENYGRPHYHVLAFNFHQDTLGKVQDAWGKGNVDRGQVEPASIAYVSNYVISRTSHASTKQPPFALISKSNGGLGSAYVTPQMKRWHKRGQRNHGIQYGYHVPLHRLYKDRIFTKLERYKMGLQMDSKMDERYMTEIERLIALHDDPVSYYQERVDQAYNRVKIKKTTKF